MVTRILFDPRVDLPDGTTGSSPVIVEATPTAIRETGAVVTFPTTLSFTVNTSADVIQLATPGAGQAWRLVVRRPGGARIGSLYASPGAILLTRTVTWTDAATIAWADLTDLDPATLAPSTAPAAWDVALAALAAQVAAGGGGSGGGLSVVDNGDGTLSSTSSSIVDNGDGTLTAV